MLNGSLNLATALIVVALVGLGSPALAQEDAESGYDRVWAIANLYTGDDDSFFQSIDLSGRLQLDLAYVKSKDDDNFEFNVRRFRFGFKTVFLRGLHLSYRRGVQPAGASSLCIHPDNGCVSDLGPWQGSSRSRSASTAPASPSMG